MNFLWSRVPIRSAEPELLDTFFVSAVSTVVLIRILLEATGYPRLGGGGLHIAHVLWGGLGMLVAIVLLLGFLSPGTRHLAAIVGGAGFGSFVDELGKFLTSDNDYFFKPTAALLYVLFVLLFFIVRQIRRYRELTPTESLVNAIEIAERLAVGTIAMGDRERALALLDRADPSEPLVPMLRQRFRTAAVGAGRVTRATRLAHAASARYAAIAGSRWFRRAIIALFALDGLGFVATSIAAVAVVVGAAVGNPDALSALGDVTQGDNITSVIQLVAGVVGGTTLLRGILALRSSRTRAYRLFEIAVLVDLLLVQPFQFLDLGFAPTVDVIFDLLLLAVLRYLDGLEQTVNLRTLESERAMALAGVARGS